MEPFFGSYYSCAQMFDASAGYVEDICLDIMPCKPVCTLI